VELLPDTFKEQKEQKIACRYAAQRHNTRPMFSGGEVAAGIVITVG
jgi:hypothetical protein